MSGTCEPTWKCTSFRVCASPSFFSNSLAATNSAVLTPNFAFSPPLVAHFPAPFAASRTRMPIIGSTPTSFDTRRISASSSIFSTTMITFFPSLLPSSAFWMKS